MSANQGIPTNYVDSPYFTFKTVRCGTDPCAEDLVFALRYQVYCLEKSFLRADDYPNGLERDEYDEFSTHITATDHFNIVVGSLRIVSPPEGTLFPFQKHCTHLFKEKSLPPPHDCVELSRFVISKVYRRRADDSLLGVSLKLLGQFSDPESIIAIQTNEHRRKQQPEILLGIVREMYRHCKEVGVKYWYVAIEPSLARMLRRINFHFEAIGEEEDYYGPVTPYLLSIDKFDSDLSSNDPEMFAWFQASLHEGDQVL